MILKNVIRFMPRLMAFRLARVGLIKPPHPLLMNFSVTNRCQSHCLTCNIWKLYKEKPELRKKELKIDEIEKIFKGMRPLLLFNICGGEPFLRDDLYKICELAYKYLKPAVMHSPTNCLAPKKIEYQMSKILPKIGKTPFTLKLSLDAIGEKHDYIRGTPGNFKKVVETYNRVVRLKKKYPHFYLDAGVTVSNLNLNDLEEITSWVEKNMPELDTFVHEIGDLRGELFNKDMDIRPTGEDYTKAEQFLTNEVKKKMKTARRISRMILALKLVYYDRAAKVMRKKKRAVPCYAAISNAHMNPWGGLWPCNIQAFDKEMGNFRDFNYNFDKLWHSKKANEVRKWIKGKHCYCPLIGQAFLDTILSPKECFKAIMYFFGLKR